MYSKCDVEGGIDWNNSNISIIYRFPGVSSAEDAPKYMPLQDVPTVTYDDIDLNLSKHHPPRRS